MFSSDGSFARRQLEKHGWIPDSGLGIRGDGLKHFIKVQLKQDTAGVGYCAADSSTDNWWTRLYNNAAASIVVTSSENGVIVTTRPEKKPSKGKKAESGYHDFVRGSVLSAGVEKRLPDSVAEAREEEIPSHIPDKELFELCGQHTAHHGARHGLRMSGKLARVAAHENSMRLARLTTPGVTVRPSSDIRETDEQTSDRGHVLNDVGDMRGRRTKEPRADVMPRALSPGRQRFKGRSHGDCVTERSSAEATDTAITLDDATASELGGTPGVCQGRGKELGGGAAKHRRKRMGRAVSPGAGGSRLKTHSGHHGNRLENGPKLGNRLKRRRRSGAK